MIKSEAVVVGAGIIGLAIARELSLRGLEVILLEREKVIGSGTSSRNSEVIHAGLYYEPESLKATLCVKGRRMLYQYCIEKGIPNKQCGKLIIANSESEDCYLDWLNSRGLSNGVEELARISRARLKSLEPQIRGTSALFSATSGIVDSHSLMLAYQADAEAASCTISFRTPVLDGVITGDVVQLRTGGAEPAELEARLLVNAAGLDAWEFSTRLAGLDPDTIPPRHLAKGNYFAFQGTTPFQHLIYPVPEPGGLGIHLTFDLAGQARFGPDVEWVDQIDYNVDAKRAHAFYSSIRRYWPDLPDGSLMPAYSGIRPKTCANGPSDFVIQGPDATGHECYIALYGMESPGLTSSLAIADVVAELALR